jgi:hypothetical protein
MVRTSSHRKLRHAETDEDDGFEAAEPRTEADAANDFYEALSYDDANAFGRWMEKPEHMDVLMSMASD